jgi:hypothetical protein
VVNAFRAEPNQISRDWPVRYSKRCNLALHLLQVYSFDANFHDINSSERPGNIKMNSEKVGGILGAIVAVLVLAIAFAYGPIGQMGKPQKQMEKIEAPAQPAPATPPARGPVVREVPQ